MRFTGTSGDNLVQPPAQAERPIASCAGPCTHGILTSPRMETQQPLWENTNTALVILTVKKSFLMLRGRHLLVQLEAVASNPVT